MNSSHAELSAVCINSVNAQSLTLAASIVTVAVVQCFVSSSACFIVINIVRCLLLLQGCVS